jgi:hypothetical protein
MADSGLSFAIAFGFSVIIQALPINKKVVLHPPKSDSQEAPTTSSTESKPFRFSFINLKFHISSMPRKLSSAPIKVDNEMAETSARDAFDTRATSNSVRD